MRLQESTVFVPWAVFEWRNTLARCFDHCLSQDLWGKASAAHTCFERVVVHAHLCSILAQSKVAVSIFDLDNGRFVPSLLLFRSPHAIARRVRSIYIQALKRHPWRAFPHISDKLSGVAKPLLADCYAAPAVAIKPLVGRICASTLRMVVCDQGAQPASRLGKSVRRLLFRQKFSLETPAASSGQTQTTAAHKGSRPAVASTLPDNISGCGPFVGRSHHDQSSVPLAGSVLEVRHGF